LGKKVDGPFIMQIYNGKRWISYNVSLTMGTDGCLVVHTL